MCSPHAPPPFTDINRALSTLTRLDPRAYLDELTRDLELLTGLDVDPSTVARSLSWMRLTRHKYNKRRVSPAGSVGGAKRGVGTALDCDFTPPSLSLSLSLSLLKFNAFRPELVVDRIHYRIWAAGMPRARLCFVDEVGAALSLCWFNLLI